MLERRVVGELPAKPHTFFEYKGKAATEFVFTRDGFAGGFSILYNGVAPTGIKAVEAYRQESKRFIGEVLSHSEVPLARRHVRTGDAKTGRHLIEARTALYRSAHCRLSVMRGSTNAGDYAFCNGDGDELYFIYEGKGVLYTMFGKLCFQQHDYLLIPRGVPYHIEAEGQMEAFVMEGDPYIEIPPEFRNPFGQLKLEAPYTHRDFHAPRELMNKAESEIFARIVTLRNDALTTHLYGSAPTDTIGWDGSVYPIRFNISDYLPKTGKIHLPPNLHLTFKSAHFVVCSFVPRMVDYLEGSIPCPYPHANSLCDEILYYVSGNFTSRKGISPRSISHHPAGVAHGPQPGNYLKSVGSRFTDELAVMVDTWEPLNYTKAALGLEDPTYVTSWHE